MRTSTSSMSDKDCAMAISLLNDCQQCTMYTISRIGTDGLILSVSYMIGRDERKCLVSSVLHAIWVTQVLEDNRIPDMHKQYIIEGFGNESVVQFRDNLLEQRNAYDVA